MTCYEERLLLYLTADNIADEHADSRKAIFLSEVGRDIYQVLSYLCSPPDKAASKTLDQLLKKLKDHFDPVPNEVAESFKFWTRVQKDNESVTDYSLAIKKLTIANFPDLIRWLRGRLVTGLNRSHAAVQEKLSNMTNQNFERAVEIAINITMVKENARQFHSPGDATVPVRTLIE